MAAIMIDIDDLQERVYKMLRDIEDGKYKDVKYGEAAGRLSCANTKAMDDMFKTLLGDCRE